ncbi:methyl-accepting chemotaxis protein [Paenibacillus hunanensis]|nr:methyl-accepting chemotaxis protein [Paenibacillus hunanensis]WPP41210.1 methyl-accepting chemotaxis protein [Paenibacillus hunanensis]GGJ15684.1 putative sensory transducer protein YfmS [Paenibacillus hunanensis]
MGVVDSLLGIMPYIGKMLREKATVSMYDRKKVLYYEQLGDFDLGFRTGVDLAPGFEDFQGVADKVNATMVSYPQELFGVPLEGVNIPVYDGSELVAMLLVMYEQTNQNHLEAIIAESRSISDNLVDMVQHVAAHAEELQATSEQILENSRVTVEKSSKINEVATLIKEISEQTNLLGLNAAIEAARVGELGAGFGVVATEVRKLSVNAKQATGDIENALREVQDSIRKMELEIAQITSSSQEQASLVSSFTDVIERLHGTSSTMQSLANNLYHYSVASK